MITDDEKIRFYDVAHRGIQHADPNFNVHGQVLFDALQHYEKLVQPKAKSALEEKIRFKARQIDRNRTPYGKSV